LSPRDVVFISSQLLTADLWKPQLAAFKGKANCTVANNSAHNTMSALAASVLAAAPKSFALVAHGMGGFISFEILRQEPARVERLVLIGTLAPADTAAQTNRRLGYLKLVQAGRFADVVNERIPLMVPSSRYHDMDLIDVVRKMAADTGADGFLRQQNAIMNRIDSVPTLAKIICPTLLIWGRSDGLASLDHQKEMLAGIKNSRLEIVEDCGHLVPLEHPVHASALLMQWLEL
jgi:pimeloyl-ACP methyl ester carboxylesterase